MNGRQMMVLAVALGSAFCVGFVLHPVDQTARGAAVGYSCGYIHAGDAAMKRDRTPDKICDVMRKNAIEVGAFPTESK